MATRAPPPPGTAEGDTLRLAERRGRSIEAPIWVVRCMQEATFTHSIHFWRRLQIEQKDKSRGEDDIERAGICLKTARERLKE